MYAAATCNQAKKKQKRIFLFDIDDATVETEASGERSNAKRFSADPDLAHLTSPDTIMPRCSY